MAAKKKTAGEVEVITIPEIKKKTIKLRLVGISVLVCHAWSEKAKKALRDKHMKVAKTAREKRDPESEFNAARYIMPDGSGYDGFPSCGIKTAMVDACSFVEGVTKVLARGAFHINPGQDLVPIQTLKPVKKKTMKVASKGHLGVEVLAPVKREDMVRVGGKGPGTGAADLRYRPEYQDWSIPIEVQYNESVISPAQIINLLNLAGFSVGLGEWRPQKNGNWGMFEVAIDE